MVMNAEKKRVSLAVFYGVDGDTVLESAPRLLDEKKPSRYRKMRPRILQLGSLNLSIKERDSSRH